MKKIKCQKIFTDVSTYTITREQSMNQKKN
jgi:hypothetical protein